MRLIGVLDSKMAAAVTQAITSTSELKVVVDLSELSSIDDGSLRSLVGAVEVLSVDGKEFSLVGATGEVMKAIQSSDLCVHLEPSSADEWLASGNDTSSGRLAIQESDSGGPVVDLELAEDRGDVRTNRRR